MEQKFHRIEIQALIENLETVQDFVLSEIEGAACPMKKEMQIKLAVEEIFVNIAHYAYKGEVGMVVIETLFDDGNLSITFTDKGIPYDPLNKEDPDTTLAPEDRQIGGLGIFLVKKLMDDVQYEYSDGCNKLKLVKEIS
ncbi:Anti-sigma regulatory factor (Ser/Thr protein kinase) [Eubacterium ruminantium]|nr:Anti-sigma regulatory factor (Ser/Thr protein kinase) [Eubacterium ruminantium]